MCLVLTQVGAIMESNKQKSYRQRAFQPGKKRSMRLKKKTKQKTKKEIITGAVAKKGNMKQ